MAKLMSKTEVLCEYAQNYDQVLDVTGVVGGVTENKENVNPDGQVRPGRLLQVVCICDRETAAVGT